MVHQKIDYISGMVYDTSISDVMKCLKINRDSFISSITDLIVNHKREALFVYYSRGNKYFSLDFGNVHLCVDFTEFQDLEKEGCKDFIDHKVKKVYIDISGLGLDWLRSNGSDPDKLFSDQYLFGSIQNSEGHDVPRFKLTRCDFSYDFVNVYGDFVKDSRAFFNQCDDLECYGVQTTHMKRPLTYEQKRGCKQYTCYIGSTGSKKLLRIYDKKLQLCKDGLPRADFAFVPFELKDRKEKGITDPFMIDSWIRFECQTRDEVAQSLLYGYGGNLDAIFKEFCDYYSICYPKEFGKDLAGRRVPCFEKLLNYVEVKRIGLNDYLV